MAQQVRALLVMSRAGNAYYKAALEKSPQYGAAVALRSRLLQERDNLPGVPVVAPLNDADGDVAAWLDAVAEADAAQRSREAKLAALRDRIQWCEKAVEDVATAS